MRRIATLERWGDMYRLITTFERSSRPKCLKNWTATLCSTFFCTDEFFGELYFVDSPKKWTVTNDFVEWRNEKYDSNLARRKRRIREYALCNDWQYFVTLTLAEGKQDRFDLALFYKRFGQWVGNYNKRYGTRLAYLIIPEQHKNGAWHAHGLFNNVADASVCRNEYGYLDIPSYRKRFGFISLSAVKDKNRTASYITKYVTKACQASDLDKGRNGFLASRGLQLSEKLDECFVPECFVSAWSNAWCGITWGSSSQTPTEMLRRAARGDNPLLSEPEPFLDTLIAVQEWKKQYNKLYTQPLVYEGRVDIFRKGE